MLFDVFFINTEKQPSPEVNPDTHYGCGIILFSTLGLNTLTVSGKAAFNESGKPQFKDARIFIMFCNPLALDEVIGSKCLLLNMISTARLNNS